MNSQKALELINEGKTEELKKILQDEIFRETLNTKSGAKSRYAAMKRYFRYSSQNENRALTMPCKDVSICGNIYNCFTDGCSVVLTTEPTGEIECFDNSLGLYFDKLFDSLISSVYQPQNQRGKADINLILADAKSRGYRYKKTEIRTGKEFHFVFKYKDSYYKTGILDQAFSIINDGQEAEIYYVNGTSPILIKTGIGMAGILPVVNIEIMKNISVSPMCPV